MKTSKKPLPTTLLLCLLLTACGTNRNEVRFRDGSVLTAKKRHGETFEQVRYVTQHGHESVKAAAATIRKPVIVFTDAVVTTAHGQRFASENYEVTPSW